MTILGQSETKTCELQISLWKYQLRLVQPLTRARVGMLVVNKQTEIFKNFKTIMHPRTALDPAALVML